ncbi:hypothetical protein K8R47_03930 [archaeon]|nr:hypothetical protein [archaeon]
MSLKEPKSMSECIYFTNRFLDNDGYIRAWVSKEMCEKCGKGLMGKPKDKKTGKVKIRAKKYHCPECNNIEEQKEYEEKLTVSIKYKCPHCGFESETQVPFKRKRIQILNEETQKKKAAESIRFQCEKCKENIDITKKMK